MSFPSLRRGAALSAALILSGVAAACRPAPPPADPHYFSEWMQAHVAVARVERLSPVLASRLSAYAAVALYEGMAAGSPRLRTLAGQLNGLDTLPQPPEPRAAYDWATVSIRAQTTVLKRLVPDASPSAQAMIAQLEQRQFDDRRRRGVSGDMAARSLAYGETLGNAIARWAGTDRFTETRTLAWTGPAGVQYWVATGTADQFVPQSLSAATDMVAMADPTATLDAGAATERSLMMTRPKRKGAATIAGANPVRAHEPYWGTLRTFVLDSAASCSAGTPPAYSEDTTSAFWREAREVYTVTRSLTPEQRTIGLFWADNPGQTGSAPAHWTSVMSGLVDELALDPERTVEMFALTGLGQADAFISCWRGKYRHNLLRPVSYIQRHIDSTWRPLVITPPFPEYPSGHSVQSSAAAEILTHLFGDSVAFTDSTQVPLGHAPRRYASFREAANEVAISRMYAGLHYRAAIYDGMKQGQCVAEQVIRGLRTREAR
jgi:hypothetical protein